MEEACHDFLSLPLSQLTSQPNREDEYARIEASGGKVIQWNGHRVFGVLAMSRSIGKRFGNSNCSYCWVPSSFYISIAPVGTVCLEVLMGSSLVCR